MNAARGFAARLARDRARARWQHGSEQRIGARRALVAARHSRARLWAIGACVKLPSFRDVCLQQRRAQKRSWAPGYRSMQQQQQQQQQQFLRGTGIVYTEHELINAYSFVFPVFFFFFDAACKINSFAHRPSERVLYQVATLVSHCAANAAGWRRLHPVPIRIQAEGGCSL